VKPDMFEHITVNNFSDKIVLKPIKSGSSVGIRILNLHDLITTDSDLSYKRLCEYMVDDIAPHDYFIEQYIDHAEYTAPIISNKVLPIIKIDTEREFYNYNAKYIDNNTSFTFPKFPASVQEKINNTALEAFALLGCSTWGRIDFFMNNDFEINLIEINSIPGMTSHSLVPMSAKHSGLNYIDLIKLLLEN
jgi:D-alanine-D-alanine ligase